MIPPELSIDNIRFTYDKIKPFINKTPFLRGSKKINEYFSSNIYFKCEFLQKSGSFKARGAINNIVSQDKNNFNKGITAVAVIETSHIAMHIWDEPHPALMQFDVYSCGEFNHTDICKKIMEDFDIHKIEYKYLNRETGLQDI